MDRKFELYENGIISDNDPIYEQLDEWHDNDEYDKILETVYAIPREMWSNRLWFRAISALNNKKQYDEARKELDEIFERCETPKDKGRYYYMLGYIYYMEDKELKALYYYRKSMEVDPKRDLIEDCAECQQYIDKGLENLEDIANNIIQTLNERMEEQTDKKEPDGDEFIMLLAFLPSIRKIPKLGKCIGLEKLFYKYNDDEKEIVKKFLFDAYGIKDRDTLKKAFRDEFSIDTKYEDVKAYLNGNPYFDIDELNDKGRAGFDACKMYIEKIIDKVPDGGMVAWDISERIGLLRQAYACDMLTNSDYASGIVTFTDEAKKYYSSWEEYVRAVILGGGFYMFFISEFCFKDGFDFICNIGPVLIDSKVLDYKWEDNR